MRWMALIKKAAYQHGGLSMASPRAAFTIKGAAEDIKGEGELGKGSNDIGYPDNQVSVS